MDLAELVNHNHLIPEVILFVERKCFADWSIGQAKIDFHDLTFVVSGKACYYINGKKHIVEAGDLLYIPEGCSREAYTFEESPMHCYPFNFLQDDDYQTSPFPTSHQQNHPFLPLGLESQDRYNSARSAAPWRARASPSPPRTRSPKAA